MSRIAKGPSDSLFKNKRSRKIAKGDGLGLRLVCKLETGKAIDLGVGACWGFAQVRRIPLCEIPSTLTPHIAAQSFERLAKDYGRRSKKIESYPRASECKSSDSASQKTRRCPDVSHVTFGSAAQRVSSRGGLRCEALRRGKSVSEAPLILVVEDEYPLQGVIEDALIEGGFETDILSSGEEALALFKGGIKNYRALVTDVKGRISGWEFARQVWEIDPEFPVVYITGAARDEWASQGVPNSILLQKPFAPAQLVTAISQLLNAGTPPS